MIASPRERSKHTLGDRYPCALMILLIRFRKIVKWVWISQEVCLIKLEQSGKSKGRTMDKKPNFKSALNFCEIQIIKAKTTNHVAVNEF